jgi:hypothetical protein
VKRLLQRLRRRRRAPTPQQGEEYEIEKAEREAQKARDRITQTLIQGAAHSHHPFLKDPFE